MLNFKSTHDLDLEIERSSCLALLREKSKVLGNYLTDSPTQYLESSRQFDVTSLRVPKKLKDKYVLALLSWYLPEEIGILIRLSLEENWGVESAEVGTIVLNSKEFALAWFIIQDRFNENDFFGNYLTEERVAHISKILAFKRESRRRVKRYTGYCRGYRQSNHRGQRPLPPEVQVGVLSYREAELRRQEKELKVQVLFNRIISFLDSSAS